MNSPALLFMSNPEPFRVLITGGTGYLGAALLRYISLSRPAWQLHATFYTHERAIRDQSGAIVDFEIAIGLTHNAINDDRTGKLMEWARGAGQNFQKHMDFLAFDALEKGDGTTYGVCYDGSDFFDNDHADPGAAGLGIAHAQPQRASRAAVGGMPRGRAATFPGSRRSLERVPGTDEVHDADVEPIPRAPHDRRVDAVATPSGTRWFTGPTAAA